MFKWKSGDFSVVDFTIDILRVIIVLVVIIGAWNTLSSGRISFAQWVNLFAAGLSQGSIYALIALGYTLVLRHPANDQFRSWRGIHGGGIFHCISSLKP